MSRIKLAEMQLSAFAFGSKGFSTESFADYIGLKKSEWLKLRNEVYLKESDVKLLDDKFGIKPCKCSRVVGSKNGVCMTCNGLR